MAQIYVTGPVDVWVRHPFDGNPLFLGHGEQAPSINISPIWRDVTCDVGGAAIFERIYAGESARVSVNLVRFNHNTYDRIRTRARSVTFPGAIPGFDAPGMIGTLALAESAAYKLYLRFPFAAKAPFANPINGALPAGYRFFAAVMDPEGIQGGSANPYKIQLSWTCYRIFDPSLANAFGFGAFALYDHNLGELAGLPIN